MEISLDLYRVFDAVARQGSLTAASRELYISQPAVSQAIARLEEGLQTQLFDRSSRGMRLTLQGEMLHGYVTSALGLMNAGESKLMALSALKEGELRIGAGDTVTKSFLMPFFSRFHEKYPEIGITVVNRVSREILSLLKSGAIDLGFVNLPLQGEGIQVEECLLVHDVFVAGVGLHPALGNRIVSLGELVQYPMIMLEKTSNSRCRVDAFFRQKGLLFEPAIELGSHSLLPDFARIGLGVAVVMKEFTDMQGLFQVETEEELPARGVGACMLEGVTLPDAARRFLDLVRKGR